LPPDVKTSGCRRTKSTKGTEKPYPRQSERLCWEVRII